MCRIDWYDDDAGACLKPPAARAARKQHRCHDCGRDIAKGETYTYAFWADLGEVKMCAHCIEAGRWLVKECGGHLYPGVSEELSEHLAEGYRELLWLVTAAKIKWQRKGALIPLDDIARQVDLALAKTAANAAQPLRMAR